MTDIQSVGIISNNQVKKEAMRAAFKRYPHFAGSEIVSVEKKLSIPTQPIGWEQIIGCAQARAEGAYPSHDVGCGIESGIFEPPFTGRSMDVCICILFDGDSHYLGYSPAFTLPLSVSDLVQSGMELNNAFLKARSTSDADRNAKGGVIDFLTDDNMNRQTFTELAVMMALAHYNHPVL